LYTVFQLVPKESYPELTLAFMIIQKLYVPLVDFMITLSILYLFYRQEMRLRILIHGANPSHRNFSGMLSGDTEGHELLRRGQYNQIEISKSKKG
jgi:hypothetical protein